MIGDKPQIGDYVICKSSMQDLLSKYINKFLTQTIGQCISKTGKHFLIKYEQIPKELKEFFHRIGEKDNHFYYFKKHEILQYSKNKKDLEIYIDANKYNL